jgi:hypothetical protein
MMDRRKCYRHVLKPYHKVKKSSGAYLPSSITTILITTQTLAGLARFHGNIPSRTHKKEGVAEDRVTQRAPQPINLGDRRLGKVDTARLRVR